MREKPLTVHFVHGMALNHKWREWLDGPIYSLHITSSSGEMRKFVETYISEILASKILISIVAVKITDEIILLSKFCIDLNLPIIWNGPIRQLNKNELDWLKQVDPSVSELVAFPASEPYFPIKHHDTLDEDNEIIEFSNLAELSGCGITLSFDFFNNWMLYSRFFIPKQNYLIVDLSKEKKPLKNLFDRTCLLFLKYARLMNVVTVESFSHLLRIFPPFNGLDLSGLLSIMFGKIRCGKDIHTFLELYGIRRYHISSLPGLEGDRFRVSIFETHKEDHIVDYSSFHVRCSCKKENCSGKLILAMKNGKGVENWGILPFLMRKGFLRRTERYPNPRSLLESIFPFHEETARFEITKKGYELLKLHASPTDYITIENLFVYNEIPDEPDSFLAEVRSTLPLESYSSNSFHLKRPFLKMVMKLAFAHGYSNIFRFTNKFLGESEN
ncbi:MAG: hypothetical protein D6732_04060 [Methanobacteriota archaeon]|nr:MAG: hypothetical protein D6732_04060 [Euryarchaeota archaeon]